MKPSASAQVLRRGEIFGLAEEYVRFDTGRLHVAHQVKVVNGHLVFGPPKRGKERDVPLPALRHFPASVLLDAGENIKALSTYLGHGDPGFTLRVYTHLMPSSDGRTRRTVDDSSHRTVRSRPVSVGAVRPIT